ncbi:MAG TPA: hypothetical protein VH021_21455 [Trebonia sp.]|nr:hypothetical protein [Trebonia sp.]
MVSPHKVVGDVAEAGLSRMVGTIAVILPAVALVQVLANAHGYRQPAAVIGVWLAVLGAAAWLAPRMRARVLSGAETAAAIAIAIAAVTVVGAERSGRVMPGSVDLAILGTLWLLVVVMMSAPLWVSLSAALTVNAAHSALLIRTEGVNSLALSELEAAGYICAAFLIAAAVLRPTMAVHVSLAGRRASLASRSAAERAAAAAIGQERQRRLAVLEREALPLLRGIADGTLDATAGDVRDRCARHAAVLRHSLSGGAPGAGELTDGLEPTLRAARERGLLVTVQLVGDPGPASPTLARAVQATLDAVLRSLPPQQVTLTVIGVGDDVELYLAFDAPSPGDPGLTRLPAAGGLPAAARWQAAVNMADPGGGYLELSWRKEGVV